MPLSNPSSPNLIGPEDYSPLCDSLHPHLISDALWFYQDHGNCPESQSWAGAWDLCPSKPAQKEPGLTLSLGGSFNKLRANSQLSIFQAPATPPRIAIQSLKGHPDHPCLFAVEETETREG